MHRTCQRLAVALLGLVLILAGSPAGAGASLPARVSAEDLPAPSAGEAAGSSARVGAYFFYWYTMPNQPPFSTDLNRYFAFHPPGMAESSIWVHLSPYQILSEGGTYNGTYYSPSSQRWWEWQFREMATANLDFAALNSWDASDFMPPAARIEVSGPRLNAALAALGNPVQVALYDDTTSEVYQWNKDSSGQLPPAQCQPPTAPGCEAYRMPLSNEANWHYFLDKVDAFYGAVARIHWATLDGRPVDQGGRPLILMHQGEGLFRDFVDGGTRYAARLMCTIKKHMIEQFGTADPFLLPNGTWGLWGCGDQGLVQPTRCSQVGISVPGDPYAIDGWSAYGMATGGQCTPSPYPGVCLFSYQTTANYTTAYIGPGYDVFTGSDPVAYSGPYGGSGPAQRPFYNGRWWSLEGEGLSGPEGDCANGKCQDRFYFQSWSTVQEANPPVNLVVIESWNELAEGTEIAKVTTYVGPDLDCGQGPPCDPLYFYQNPYQESPWSPSYWLLRTGEIIAQWKGLPSGPQYPVDDPADIAGWARDQGNLGPWFYGSYFHYCQENDPVSPVWWSFTPPDNGYYDVYAYWPYVQGATQQARYTIHHGQGSAQVRIDQSRRWDAGGWAFLGRYPFRAGVPQGVALSSQVDNPQGRRVLADAVRFVYRTSWAPTPMPAQRFLPLIRKDRQALGEVLPPQGRAYPEPEALPAPAPSAYPGPTPPPGPTPRPSPTPAPSPTPGPPDTTPPQSQVNALPTFTNRSGFWVTWTAHDPGGSGVARVHIQARDGPAGAWTDWQSYAGPWHYYTGARDGHTYYFRSRATDWAGNIEPWPAGPNDDTSTTVDLSTPSSAVVPLPLYSPDSFTVSWSGQDATSGIAAYDIQYCRGTCDGPEGSWTDWLTATSGTAATFSLGQDGQRYSFRSRARDRAGNVEPWSTQPDAGTLVDTLPPSSRVDELPLYSGPSFTVAWSGQDTASGIAAYDVQVCREHCLNPLQAVWYDWLLETTATEALYSGEEGPVYFRSRARDRAGHLEPYPLLADARTTIDTTAPSSQVEALPPYRQPTFTVAWSGQDAGSGIAAFDVQVCRGKCTQPEQGEGGTWTDWITGTSAFSALFSGGEDGESLAFRSRARDRAGNVEPWPVSPDTTTTIDAVPPWSHVQPLPAYSPAPFTVTWSGDDQSSGIATYDLQYCLDECAGPGSRWMDWLVEFSGTAALFRGEADGHRYAFRSRAHDRAGNTEDWPAVPDAETTMDATPPESAVGPLPAYSPAVFTVSWSGYDAASGLASFDVQYREGVAGTWRDWLTATTVVSATYEGRDGQAYFFRSRARDAVGNTEPWPPAPDAGTTVDTSAPKSRVGFLPAYSPAVFIVTWAGQDTGAGIAAYDVQVCIDAGAAPLPDCWQDLLSGTLAMSTSFSGTHGQSYRFRCRARDALGNQEAYRPTADTGTKVDNEGPATWMEAPLSFGSPATFLLRWNGRDDMAGLASYSLYYRDESAESWQPWLEQITVTQGVFSGQAGHTYYFCVRGTDRVGNLEDKLCPGKPGAWPIEGEATIAVPPTSRVEPLPPVAPGPSFQVHWSGTPRGMLYEVQVMDRAVGTWEEWLPSTRNTWARFDGQPGHTYAFRCRVLGAAGQGPLEPWPWAEDAWTTVPTSAPAGNGDRAGNGAVPARQTGPWGRSRPAEAL